jgi:exopolysaccharide biosynthesis predicted pyruvyltransferase EpsI
MVSTLPTPSSSTPPRATQAFEVQRILHTCLAEMDDFNACALLNYPNHTNIGDHLIWLGNLLYLRQVRNIQVGYTASSATFDPDTMTQRVGKAPILLHGGGSLGDLWYSHQQFRESIIQRYPDRPIVILPQTVYFQDPVKLKQAATIFNRHPNLTIFARDQVSYQLAADAFDRCRVLLAPDMAFQLVHLADFPVKEAPRGILYQCRSDLELAERLSLNSTQLPHLTVGDWRPYDDHWVMGPDYASFKRTLATFIRNGWQRGVRHPQEWGSRRRWDTQFKPTAVLDSIYPADAQHRSWSFAHSGVYQFRHYELIITNRLHGHILATLLGIPHLFLANSYHKNRAFYESWTAGIPFCQFVDDPAQIPSAALSLLNNTASA